MFSYDCTSSMSTVLVSTGTPASPLLCNVAEVTHIADTGVVRHRIRGVSEVKRRAGRMCGPMRV
jgi:hypothetical protein